MVWGLRRALSVMVTEPVYLALVVGVKETMMEHVPPAKTVPRHVFVWLKPAPLAAMPLIIKGAVPVFFKLTGTMETVLRAILPNDILVVERLTV